ncbi:MAG TPA: amino acid permease [Bryobacteraceae bacterium]|nr:amino acid permease [Bryobacteraceae bacterium]
MATDRRTVGTAVTTEGAPPGLEKRLGLLDATTIVMGSMIGSGIFIVSADIARQVHSPGLLVMVWVVTALLTLVAALSYGELAAAMPQAGGQYVYLREAFGPMYGFLYGWTLFLVIQTGTIAAVAVAFAKFAGVFFPGIAVENRLLPFLNTQQLVAIAVIVLLTWVNTRGVKTGSVVQNVFTFAKTAALLGLIGFGLFLGRNETAVARNFGDFWGGADWTWTTIRLVGVAMVGGLFSADAWNNVTFIAGEIKNARRNLPLALVLGVGIVCAFYISCNFVYLNALPLESIQSAPQDRVATAVAQQVFGPSAVQLLAAAIMVSTFGCVNGLVLAGARVYYAMALDKLFFRKAAEVDPVHRIPGPSLWMQCLWAALLTLTGRYGDLLDYVIFAVLLFYILTIAGLFVLRRTQPGLERPYKAFGYPVLPALYIAVAGLIEILLLLYKPNYTWPGLIIVLLGIPVYFFWRNKEEHA